MSKPVAKSLIQLRQSAKRWDAIADCSALVVGCGAVALSWEAVAAVPTLFASLISTEALPILNMIGDYALKTGAGIAPFVLTTLIADKRVDYFNCLTRRLQGGQRASATLHANDNVAEPVVRVLVRGRKNLPRSPNADPA